MRRGRHLPNPIGAVVQFDDVAMVEQPVHDSAGEKGLAKQWVPALVHRLTMTRACFSYPAAKQRIRCLAAYACVVTPSKYFYVFDKRRFVVVRQIGSVFVSAVAVARV